MTKMTSTDYKALAERVAQRAIYADNNADPNNKAWAADLRAVVSLLNGMADAQPFFWIGPVTRDAITTLKKSGRETLPDMTLILKGPRAPLTNLVGLYLHPAPAAPQAEPEREPLSDERIDEIGDPFGYFQYGDAQGDKRRAFARAVERAAYERAAALVIELTEDNATADAIRALGRQHD